MKRTLLSEILDNMTQEKPLSLEYKKLRKTFMRQREKFNFLPRKQQDEIDQLIDIMNDMSMEETKDIVRELISRIIRLIIEIFYKEDENN